MKHKLYYLLIFIQIILIIKPEEIPVCCCFFDKDAFRGFQITKTDIFNIKKTGLDKAEIGNMVMNVCLNKKGFPTVENIERLKTGNFLLTSKKCERECNFLTRQLNDNYNIKQETNRNIEAKRLREIKNELARKINAQIAININNLHIGKGCEVSVSHRTKTSLDYKGQLLNEGLIGNRRKFSDSSNESDILSFDSVSLPSHHSLDNPELEKALNAYNDNNDNNFNGIKLDDNKVNYEYSSNEEINQKIDELELEIMYLEKKNTRPLDFILERFTIKDTILVMVIKIFERTLDEVLLTMKRDLEDMIYFQFKIVENSNSVK